MPAIELPPCELSQHVEEARLRLKSRRVYLFGIVKHAQTTAGVIRGCRVLTSVLRRLAGFTMLITAVCVELSILADGFFGQIYDGKGMHAITISMTSLIDGNFAAAALLISFGALIGKAGPLQLLVLAILETIAYNANKQLLLNGAIGIADIGGTVIIHNFGAYFGLGAAYVFGVPAKKDLDDATTSTVSDLLSMIGTVFLWLYWPSFVAGEAEPSQMLTARINTVRLSKVLCLSA